MKKHRGAMNKVVNQSAQLHQLVQPLNIIILSCGNIRHRIMAVLGENDAEYLETKLNRIEEQVARMNQLLQELQQPVTR
ncbi:MAG: hypothetical protein ACK4SJ_04655 [Sphingorhabdus sp.]